MYEMLNNFSRKSFKNYNMEENMKFNKRNIIFGSNGRGKTSLALGIKEELELVGKDNIRYYYNDYIDDLIMLEDTDKLKGVKATFGITDININKQIMELENQKIDLSNLRLEIEETRNQIKKLINNIHDSKKGNLRISQKSKKFSIEKVIDVYEKNIDDAKKIESDTDKIKQISGNDTSLENKLEYIYKLDVPNFKISEEIEFEYINYLLQKNYDDVTIPNHTVIEWLKTGLELHGEDESHCIFCENELDYKRIAEKVYHFQSNEKEKDVKYLIDVKKVFESTLTIYTNYLLNKEKYEILQLENKISEEEENLLKEDLSNIINILDGKIVNMENEFQDFSPSYWYELCNKLEFIQENIDDRKIVMQKDLSNKIDKLKEIVLGSIGLEIIENEDIKNGLSKVKKQEEEYKELETNNAIISGKISDLRVELSDYNDFKTYLNKVLASLNIHIKLEFDDKNENYYLIHTVENVKLNITSISEGEKNLLAFLFFYFELFKDKEQSDIKENISIIIIDDPINSFDESNRFYVLEILRKLIKDKFNQLFLFTHSWNDFCDITYGLNEKKYNFYEVYKNHRGNSLLKLINNNVTPYKKLFQEIFEISQKHEGDIEDDECYYYHSINSIRRVFEEFLSLKLKSNNKLPQKSNQPEIEEIYRVMTETELSNNQKIQLGAFLTNINVLSHKPYRASDVIKSSKFLMEYIKKVDKVHFNAMKD